ncbi:MAG TPA: hypothetical protein DCX07_02400 [Phycisphaerales bacterium]|nr:hypothetical protein [Phycisphaerales bacterium]
MGGRHFMSNVETSSSGAEADGDSRDESRSADVLRRVQDDSRGGSESRGAREEKHGARGESGNADVSRGVPAESQGGRGMREGSHGDGDSRGGSGARGENRDGDRGDSRNAGEKNRGVSGARASVESFAPDIAPSVGAGEVAARIGGSGRRRPLPPKLYRIGEVVAYSGVSRQTIHNYTTMGLLQESRWTEGGHRLYDESVFDRLDRIGDLKSHHKSLREIRDHFDQSDRQDG